MTACARRSRFRSGARCARGCGRACRRRRNRPTCRPTRSPRSCRPTATAAPGRSRSRGDSGRRWPDWRTGRRTARCVMRATACRPPMRRPLLLALRERRDARHAAAVVAAARGERRGRNERGKPRATQSGSMNVHCRPLVVIVRNRPARDMPPRPGRVLHRMKRNCTFESAGRDARVSRPVWTRVTRRATRRVSGRLHCPDRKASARPPVHDAVGPGPAARSEWRSANQMRACPIFLQVSDETERHDAMRRGWCERRCCNGRKARRESARRAGLLSGSLRKLISVKSWCQTFLVSVKQSIGTCFAIDVRSV